MKKIIFILIVAALLFTITGSIHAQKSEYKIQSSDVLSITVHGHADLSTKTRVTTDGYISFPLIGKVSVKDLTVQELEQKIKGLLEKSYLVNAAVLVFIEEYHLKQVSVIGEVNKPGKYDMPQEKDITFLEAIAMAGGFTKEGDIKNIKVMRIEDGEQKTIKINANEIAFKGEKDKDIIIKPGDIISVPEGFYRVSVIGEVNKPGKIDMPREKNMSLMQAIAMAEGFTKHADITNTRVMRMENGEKKTLKINIKDITDKGEKEKDIELQPEDIVYVPESFF